VLKVESGDADLPQRYIRPANFPGLIGQPAVEEPGRDRAAIAARLSVPEQDGQAVRHLLVGSHRLSIDRTKIVKLLSGTGQALEPQIYPAVCRVTSAARPAQFYGYEQSQGQPAPQLRPAYPNASR